MNDHLYKNTTPKSSQLFACDFKLFANKYGFSVPNEDNMNMMNTFSIHGAVVKEDFENV